ncbi:Uncharacterized protein OBRU01_07021, partial [Operophtera brumata]
EIVHKGVIKLVRNSSIAPGTLVRVKRGREVPADLVLLCSAGEQGKCFVTTANLDGETNLKTLRIPTLESLVLSPDNLMLRGSRVKNTEWAIGCAVYTGEETKLALNSKYTGNKFSSCELAVNGFLLFFIFILVAEMIASLGAKMVIERRNPGRELYLGPGTQQPARVGDLLQDFFSFLLLYYYIIPMSLYTGRPAVANTSDLNEELGQVEVLFSDKTGTLTKNLMVFKACSINGKLFEERDSTLYDTDIKFFFTILALCHSVQISNEDMKKLSARLSRSGNLQLMNFFRRKKVNKSPTPSNNNNVNNNNNTTVLDNLTWNSIISSNGSKMDYQASSPDERALVEAADRIGVTFLGEEGNNLLLKVGEHTEMYERLQLIEFTSERKRMSVIVRDKDGRILLFCKGAESSVFPLCKNSKMVEDTNRDIDVFANRGLRTLAIAFRLIPDAEVLERQLTLVGATGVEDCLQDDVADTLASLRRAGIKTWVLTGDKLTLVGATGVEDCLQDNVANTLAALRRTGIKTWVLTGDKDDVADTLAALRRAGIKTWVLTGDKLTLVGATGVEDCLQDDVADTLAALRRAGIKTWVLTGDKVETAINVAQSCAHISENDRRMFMLGIEDSTAVQAHLTECRRTVAEPSYRDLTLVVDGTSMGEILDTPHAAVFAEISLKCTAVLCCRLSPIQKAKIVKLIKNSPQRPITAAIGDGANDISMIQEAHVGFGIFGREGHQAARSRVLNAVDIRLDVPHSVQPRVHVAAVSHPVCDGAALAQGGASQVSHITCYNITTRVLNAVDIRLDVPHSVQPRVHVAAVSHPVCDGAALAQGGASQLMSWSHFMAWCVSATYHSVVIYMFADLTLKHSIVSLDGKGLDLWCYGALLFHLMMVVVSLKLWLHARYHTLLNVNISMVISRQIDGDVLGTYIRLLKSPAFWFLNFLVVVATLGPDMILRLLSDKWGARLLAKPSRPNRTTRYVN